MPALCPQVRWPRRAPSLSFPLPLWLCMTMETLSPTPSHLFRGARSLTVASVSGQDLALISPNSGHLESPLSFFCSAVLWCVDFLQFLYPCGKRAPTVRLTAALPCLSKDSAECLPCAQQVFKLKPQQQAGRVEICSPLLSWKLEFREEIFISSSQDKPWHCLCQF